MKNLVETQNIIEGSKTFTFCYSEESGHNTILEVTNHNTGARVRLDLSKLTADMLDELQVSDEGEEYRHNIVISELKTSTMSKATSVVPMSWTAPSARAQRPAPATIVSKTTSATSTLASGGSSTMAKTGTTTPTPTTASTSAPSTVRKTTSCWQHTTKKE